MGITKTLRDNVTGKIYKFNFESEPTEQDLNEAVEHVKSLQKQEQAQQQPQPEQPAQPAAWYDVPGKWKESSQRTIGAIQREADLTAQGKQPMWAGAAWSTGHATGDIFNKIGDMLSPITDNPISQTIAKGVNKFDEMLGNKARQKELAGNPNLLKEGYQRIAEFIQKNPEYKNRASTLFNIGTSLIGGPEAKALTKIGPEIKNPLSKEALISFAERSQNRQVPILAKEYNQGARKEFYSDYGVVGEKPIPTAQKWESIKQPVLDNLDQRIYGQLDNPDNISKLEDIKKSAEKFIDDSKHYSPTEKRDQKIALQKIYDEKFVPTYKDGKINIAQAQREKIAAGRNSDWKGVDEPTTAQAWEALYNGLKTNVENKGSPGIRELNKALSEIIPMQRAAEKRVIVKERPNFVSLDDLIGVMHSASSASSGNLAPLALTTVNIMAKSPITAKGAFNLAQGGKTPKGIKAIQDAMALPMKPSTANTANPAYFRKGVNPLSENEKLLAARKAAVDAAKKKAEAESRAIPDAIRNMNPKVDSYQEMIDAIRRFQTGKDPDYLTARIPLKEMTR